MNKLSKKVYNSLSFLMGCGQKKYTSPHKTFLVLWTVPLLFPLLQPTFGGCVWFLPPLHPKHLQVLTPISSASSKFIWNLFISILRVQSFTSSLTHIPIFITAASTLPVCTKNTQIKVLPNKRVSCLKIQSPLFFPFPTPQFFASLLSFLQNQNTPASFKLSIILGPFNLSCLYIHYINFNLP